MVLFFFLVFGIYFALVIALITGWQIALEEQPLSTTNHFHKIAVVVPFRNEGLNVADLLESLAKQDYPAPEREFILVDDHSTDSSSAIIEMFCSEKPGFKLLHLPETMNGKKDALRFGIESASGEIIVTTDADCTFSPAWLSLINRSFQNPGRQMIVGAVKVNSVNTFFSKLQAMEFASLMGSGAATLSYGVPTMCNGANLAFRKSAYESVNGYVGNLDIPSGDDEFLMRKIKEKFPQSIYFLGHSESIVTTQPQSTLRQFLQQRIRWAGKWKFNPALLTKLLAVFVFIFQVVTLLIWLVLIFNLMPVRTFFLLMGTKWLLEFLFLYQVSSFLNERWRWTSFLTLQFIYPFYVFWVALLTNSSSFEWKGRRTPHKK